MKIVHVLLGKANPETMNGVNKVVHHLAEAQAAGGHDVEVWGLTRNPEAEGVSNRAYWRRFFTVTRSRFALSSALRLAIKDLNGSSWVQLHSAFIPEFRTISSALRQRGIVFGITPHGGYSPGVFRRGRLKKTTYFRLVESTILHRALFVHAIGASELGEIQRLVPRVRVILVPNGQAPLERPEASDCVPSVERPVFCYCGRLALEHKGLDLLLLGFEKYRAGGGAGTLWLIGDGPDRRVLEEMVVATQIRDHVTFFGARFGQEKLALLGSADAFVHTSRWDGVPTAVLEAAAIGLPLVVSVATNLGDAVAEAGAGVVLPQNSPIAIAAALSSLANALACGEASAMAAAAKEMVATRFAWPRIATDLEAAYHLACRRAGSTS